MTRRDLSIFNEPAAEVPVAVHVRVAINYGTLHKEEDKTKLIGLMATCSMHVCTIDCGGGYLAVRFKVDVFFSTAAKKLNDRRANSCSRHE